LAGSSVLISSAQYFVPPFEPGETTLSTTTASSETFAQSSETCGAMLTLAQDGAVTGEV